PRTPPARPGPGRPPATASASARPAAGRGPPRPSAPGCRRRAPPRLAARSQPAAAAPARRRPGRSPAGRQGKKRRATASPSGLAARTEERRTSRLDDAFHRPRTAGGAARLALAAIDAEVVLEIALPA